MPRGLDFLNKYQEIVRKEPQVFQKDYFQIETKISKASIKNKDTPIGFLYNPLFFSKKEIAKLSQACEQLVLILDKVIKEYLKNREFRSAFNFSKKLEELITIDKGFAFNFPMARFDLFYDFTTGFFKFCELNADGSSGMTKSLLLDEEFSKSRPLQILKDNFKISYLNPVDSWIKALLENYYSFRGYSKEKPSIAIMDINWAKQGTVSEFQEFQRKLEILGYPTIICDPRELKFFDGKLNYQDRSIDLIYRRAVTSDLLEIYDEIEDLIEALQNKKVCMVGPFCSQVIHNKQIFAILHKPELTTFLTKEEKNFIAKYIPFTAIFQGNLVERLIDNQNNWVLKPLDAYQSRGVYIGRDYTREKWQEIIKTIPEDKYLVQEFVEVPKLSLIDFRKELVEQEYNQMIGLFMYNKKFTGVYTRVSPLNNVASGLGAVNVANFLVETI